MEKEEELRRIIEGCKRNERKSQEMLFKLFYGKMLTVCFRYTSDKDSAQEILQEGFIKVYAKLDAFDFKGSFEGWVRRIVANTAIDSLRKGKKLSFVENEDYVFQSPTENPMEEQEFDDEQTLKAKFALEAIQELSPAYRTVFNLFVIENYGHKEIAEMLGVTEGTSKSNLAKAKQNLQRIVEKKWLKFAQE